MKLKSVLHGLDLYCGLAESFLDARPPGPRELAYARRHVERFAVHLPADSPCWPAVRDLLDRVRRCESLRAQTSRAEWSALYGPLSARRGHWSA